ncbi:DUF4124 domain-containing protein [Cellvibrio sp. OA-2007]|uniref:DUF4124 domain-containing protein n=1 Tax=Cellvibrio sp. OA-2007 TaxID=529823 RepID=UPI0007839AFD|nr:DUF4124 domain-containing protein [Cellvibrio sp. OA-2007]
MKRLLFKSLTLALLVFFIGNYLIYLKTGQMPLRDMRERMGDDWWVDLQELWSPGQLAADAKQAMKSVADKVSEPEPAPPTTVYKWTDANGQVHFGDKPVASNAEQIAVDTRNAISAPEASAPIVRQQAAAEPKAPVQESALDKARAAATAMQQRVQQQEQLQ